MSPDISTPTRLTRAQADELRHEASVVFVDAHSRQLKELFLIHSPAHISEDKTLLYASDSFAEYERNQANNCEHIFYPWNRHLVKTVGAADYFRLKTNRNQDLITAREQVTLRDYRIAVFGLSVGSNIVRVLAQAGISKRIIIADFDELDTTNLNRILAGVHEVGLNKAVIAARRIYEDDPFADVTTLTNGIDEATLEKMLEDDLIDCIIDEVDHMPFKIACRKLAMRHKKPVVMVTDNGDGVVLHVERYDLGLTTIFGKRPEYFDSISKNEVSREIAGMMIMEDIVGGVEHVDPLMLRSVKRVLAKELVSWSQLGSAAILGGVVVTYIIKQIALGRSTDTDIRAYIAPNSGSWSSHA